MAYGIEEGLAWWSDLTRDEKARWLQCKATPEEIDADLDSPDPDVRAAAGIAAVGDAFLAYNAALQRAGERTRPGLYVCVEEDPSYPAFTIWAGSSDNVAFMFNKFKAEGIELIPSQDGKTLLMAEGKSARPVWVETEAGVRADMSEWLPRIS